jgi:hypothetical protein
MSASIRSVLASWPVARAKYERAVELAPLVAEAQQSTGAIARIG